jgi:hypothetical protein
VSRADLPPSFLWRSRQTKARLVLKPKPTNHRGDFEDKIIKPQPPVLKPKPPETVTACFEAKLPETIKTGFETKPVETVTTGFEAQTDEKSYEWF